MTRFLPHWHNPVFMYMREPRMLESAHSDEKIAAKYIHRREAFRTGLELLWAAVRWDPRWSWSKRA